jgi:hypothetical protein
MTASGTMGPGALGTAPHRLPCTDADTVGGEDRLAMHMAQRRGPGRAGAPPAVASSTTEAGDPGKGIGRPPADRAVRRASVRRAHITHPGWGLFSWAAASSTGR